MNYILRRRGWGLEICNGIAENMKQPVAVILNNPVPSGLSGYVFRWGTTSTILDKENVTIVNTAKAIHAGYEKDTARLEMQYAGIVVPETWKVGDRGVPRPSPSEPLLVRPRVHQAGSDMHLVTSPRALIEAASRVGAGGYISRFIKKEKEYRVFIVSSRAIAVSEKIPTDPSALGWGDYNAREENVRWDNWPLAVVAEAIAASALFGYDFCAVDVVVDSSGIPFVLECNSAPASSPYRYEKFAQAFDYIIEHGKRKFDIPPRAARSYKALIHPAVSSEAFV